MLCQVTHLSADAHLPSDDMSVACVLERLARERVADGLSDPMLSKIAGETSDIFWM